MSEWMYILWKDACYLNKRPTIMCLAKKQKTKKQKNHVWDQKKKKASVCKNSEKAWLFFLHVITT